MIELGGVGKVWEIGAGDECGASYLRPFIASHISFLSCPAPPPTSPVSGIFQGQKRMNTDDGVAVIELIDRILAQASHPGCHNSH